MTQFQRLSLALAGLLLTAAGATAATVEVGGVKLEDTTDVRGTTLQLNGAGVRYKAVFKVYAAGLYLNKKAGTSDEVYAAPGPKRMAITVVRDIDSNELGKAFTKGIEDNTSKGDYSKLIPGILKMTQIFSDQKKMVVGETITIDWVPGTGMLVSVKGKPQGDAIKEPEFYNAMLRIWLGPQPADWKLKDALLGKPA